ncbi:MAG: flavin reductase family protein [Alphaproteobacteria bacterium]
MNAPAHLPLRARFLNAMSSAATTVNVVTTDGIAGRFGATVSAMASVSADTDKPTLLVCIYRNGASATAILGNGAFCLNVLRADQSHISDAFAGKRRPDAGDKFAVAEWTRGPTGSPRLIDPLVAFDCRVTNHLTVVTHEVVFGAVEDIFMAAGSPLVYANRAYGTVQRFHRLE